jgi:hypothetical protein
MGGRGRRGRMPSIRVTAHKVHEMRRTLKALSTELRRVEQRLRSLDSFYRKMRFGTVTPAASRPGRRSGINVRDLSFKILKGSRRGLPISEIAGRVARIRGGQVGARFTQNLGIALMRDRRFKRVDRGVYALR